MATAEFDEQLRHQPQTPEFSRRSLVAGVMRNGHYGDTPLQRLNYYLFILEAERQYERPELDPLMKTALAMREELING